MLQVLEAELMLLVLWQVLVSDRVQPVHLLLVIKGSVEHLLGESLHI